VLCFAAAFCPGGERVWPRSGFWSLDEYTAPVRCALETACPGALGESAEYPVLYLPNGARNTRQCAEGYAGSYCADCAARYYKDYLSCVSCGAQSADNTELISKITAWMVFFALLAFCTYHISACSHLISSHLMFSLSLCFCAVL